MRRPVVTVGPLMPVAVTIAGEVYAEQPVPALDSEATDFRAASESFAVFRRLRPTDQREPNPLS